MRSKLRQVGIREKARRIRAGSSNTLIDYFLTGTIQLTKLVSLNNNILRASVVIGRE